MLIAAAMALFCGVCCELCSAGKEVYIFYLYRAESERK